MYCTFTPTYVLIIYIYIINNYKYIISFIYIINVLSSTIIYHVTFLTSDFDDSKSSLIVVRDSHPMACR